MLDKYTILFHAEYLGAVEYGLLYASYWHHPKERSKDVLKPPDAFCNTPKKCKGILEAIPVDQKASVIPDSWILEQHQLYYPANATFIVALRSGIRLRVKLHNVLEILD